MPRQRPPQTIWRETRRRIWLRDQGRCQGPYCQDKAPWTLQLSVAHVDHIRSGKFGSNADDNLRLLCRRCHVLRRDKRHRGMTARALAEGLIPYNWRELLWDDQDISTWTSSTGDEANSDHN